jgi:hypothetical protein
MSPTPPRSYEQELVALYEAFEACQPLVASSGLDPTETEIQVTRLLLRSIERILGGHPIKDALSWAIRCLQRLLGRIRRARRLIAVSEMPRLPAPDPGDPFAVGLHDLWLGLGGISMELADLLSPVELRCLWAARDAEATREAADRAGVSAAHYRDAFGRALGKITWLREVQPCLVAACISGEAEPGSGGEGRGRWCRQ